MHTEMASLSGATGTSMRPFNIESEELEAEIEREKTKAFAAALLNCASNGFFYGFSIFSARLAKLTGLGPADIVILGVLSQAGLGVFQYPTTLLINRAQRKGVSNDQLDQFLSIYGGMVFTLSVAGIGAVLYSSENGNAPSPSVAMGLLSLFFLFWGQGAGSTMNACSTVINFNNQNDNKRRRRDLVMLSSSIGAGGVLVVVLYHFAFAEYALSSFFFGLMVVYLCLMAIRVKWMVRIKHKIVSSSAAPAPLHPPNQTDNLESQTVASPPPPVIERISPQPLSVLLSNDVVLLTYLGTFLGVGVGGTVLSSLGNIGPKIDPTQDMTFTLTLTFLVLQTCGRIINAIVYGLGDWPYIFAFWHVFCLSGICSFIIAPNATGAFVSAAFVGTSFGGFHSSFPILVATIFPGNPTVDYSQSLGLALAASSVGCIVVGQLTTVVYKTGSIEDLMKARGFLGMFLFFMSLLVISTLSAVVLGRRIRLKHKRNALVNTVPLNATTTSSSGRGVDEGSLSSSAGGINATSFATLLREQDRAMLEMNSETTSSFPSTHADNKLGTSNEEMVLERA